MISLIFIHFSLFLLSHNQDLLYLLKDGNLFCDALSVITVLCKLVIINKATSYIFLKECMSLVNNARYNHRQLEEIYCIIYVTWLSIYFQLTDVTMENRQSKKKLFFWNQNYTARSFDDFQFSLSSPFRYCFRGVISRYFSWSLRLQNARAKNVSKEIPNLFLWVNKCFFNVFTISRSRLRCFYFLKIF